MLRILKHLTVIAIVIAALFCILYVLHFLPSFSDEIEIYSVENSKIKEASGIVASRMNPGKYWVHNDKPGGNIVYLMNSDGSDAGSVRINGLDGRDVEDITISISAETGAPQICLADIGDNDSNFEVKCVYKFAEPALLSGEQLELDKNDIEIQSFCYPDQPRDAEAIFFDPFSEEFIIISKREKNVICYSVSAANQAGKIPTARIIGTLPLSLIVGADISADGMNIIIKTYGAVYAWRRAYGETVEHVLQRKPIRLPYFPEPQGEAICWSLDGLSYLTIPEEFLMIPAYLTHYPLREPALFDKITKSHFNKTE